MTTGAGTSHRREAAGGLRLKRSGPGEVTVVDARGREIATIHKQPERRRWRVAMSSAVVRALSSADPEFDTRHAALSWLSDVQFD